MIELEDIKGIKMVGFRYGEAPEYSWNYAENKPENDASIIDGIDGYRIKEIS